MGILEGLAQKWLRAEFNKVQWKTWCRVDSNDHAGWVSTFGLHAAVKQMILCGDVNHVRVCWTGCSNNPELWS